jgi:hypothetical protein
MRLDWDNFTLTWSVMDVASGDESELIPIEKVRDCIIDRLARAA